MCTAITYRKKKNYFGRTLDLSYSYKESVTVTPRKYRIGFRCGKQMTSHHAIIGMAYVSDGFPLYYDAVNEYGLAMAGLNFPGNAYYGEPMPKKTNIASFELIPWLLGQCRTVDECRKLISSLNIVNTPFKDDLPPSPLHWIITDKKEAVTLEQTKEGLKLYDNPYGVLTNNPPFDFMEYYIANFRGISKGPSENRMAENLSVPVYCDGMSAIGLPGDYSSASRFVKAVFVSQNALEFDTDEESVENFFHMLDSVKMPKGCVLSEDGRYDYTVYLSCMNLDTGVYFYSTYENRGIIGVNMHSSSLDGEELTSYPLGHKTSRSPGTSLSDFC